MSAFSFPTGRPSPGPREDIKRYITSDTLQAPTLPCGLPFGDGKGQQYTHLEYWPNYPSTIFQSVSSMIGRSGLQMLERDVSRFAFKAQNHLSSGDATRPLIIVTHVAAVASVSSLMQMAWSLVDAPPMPFSSLKQPCCARYCCCAVQAFSTNSHSELFRLFLSCLSSRRGGAKFRRQCGDHPPGGKIHAESSSNACAEVARQCEAHPAGGKIHAGGLSNSGLSSLAKFAKNVDEVLSVALPGVLAHSSSWTPASCCKFPHLSAPLWVTPEPSISTRSPVMSFSVEHMYRDASILCLPDGRGDGVARQELYHGFSGPKCAHPPALCANVLGCAFGSKFLLVRSRAEPESAHSLQVWSMDVTNCPSRSIVPIAALAAVHHLFERMIRDQDQSTQVSSSSQDSTSLSDWAVVEHGDLPIFVQLLQSPNGNSDPVVRHLFHVSGLFLALSRIWGSPRTKNPS